MFRFGKTSILFAALFAAQACAQCVAVGPRTIAGNFTVDLDGQLHDPEGQYPTLWGKGDSWVWPLTFKNVPQGYHVRILSLSGDVVARFTTESESGAPPIDGKYTGFLGGIMTAPTSAGSAYADYAADDILMYRQGDVGADGVGRIDFEQTFPEDLENAVLGADNKLYFKVAKYLDETPYLTHIEITFSSIVFRYEQVGCAG